MMNVTARNDIKIFLVYYGTLMSTVAMLPTKLSDSNLKMSRFHNHDSMTSELAIYMSNTVTVEVGSNHVMILCTSVISDLHV